MQSETGLSALTLNLEIGRNKIKRTFELFIQLGIFGVILYFPFCKVLLNFIVIKIIQLYRNLYCNKIGSIKFNKIFQSKFGTFLFCHTPPPTPV